MTKVLVTNVTGPAGTNGADGAPGAPGPPGTPLAFNDLTDVDTTGAVDGKFLSQVSGVWVPVNAPSLSVQDENGTAITNVTQFDFQGAGVTATAGTGEVIVTIPGSNSIRFYQDWAGAWSSIVDYPQGAIVSRNYALWVALQDPAIGTDPASQAPALGAWNAGANTVTSTNWSGVTSVAFKFQVISAIRVKGVSERWGGAGAAGTFGLASAIGATITWLTDSSGAQTKISVTPASGTVTATFTGHVDLVPGVDYFVVADLCAGNLARADSNSMPNTGITQSAMYYGATYGSSDSFTRGEFRLYSETGAPWDLLFRSAIELVNTVAVSGSAVTLPDVTTATMHKLTLTANCTVTLPTPGAGKSMTIEINQDATGSRTLSFATPSGAIQWPGGTAPTWSTAASKRDLVTFVCIGGTNWLGSSLLDMR